MGSFNVACSVSNISLSGGMPTVYLPLVKPQYYAADVNPTAVGDNALIYPNCLFAPLTLPIFGDYFDYGYITPERNEYIEWLEERFGDKIETIVDRDYDKHGIVSGMFVHREIYDAMLNETVMDEWGKRDGFFVWTKEKATESYDKLVKEWAEAAAKDVADKKERLDRIEAIRSSGANMNDTGVVLELSHLLSNALGNDWNRRMLSDYDYTILNREYHKFREHHEQLMKDGLFKDRFVDFSVFSGAMSRLNQFYHPAANGPQFGNYYAIAKLHEVAMNISKDRIQKEKEWDNEN